MDFPTPKWRRSAARLLSAAFTLAGCGSTSSNTAAPLDAGESAAQDGGPLEAADGGPLEAAADAREEAPGADAADTSTVALLVVSLDPTLDQPGDDLKATSITEARLLDGNGAAKATATLSSGGATFALRGLAPGDYFIEINADPVDLVPTRLDDPTQSLVQAVGQKLRASYIGPPGSPTYRVNTYSAGQNESPVVRYSDGTTIPGEQPYLIYAFATSELEIRLMGTGATLTSLPLPRCVGHSYDPADAWLLNTTNEDHHGDFYNADGGAGGCQTCHWYGSGKKYTYSVITPTDGWCFKCHYGTAGSSAGFVDPTK